MYDFMKRPFLILVLLSVLVSTCDTLRSIDAEPVKVFFTGAMSNVMWKGDLSSYVKIDTLSGRNALYGVGPLEELRGEILIHDGEVYVAKISENNIIQVERSANVSAPFFVYSTVHRWKKVDMPEDVISIADLEVFLTNKYESYKEPFPFKLSGMVSRALIHVQNLPPGTKVRSPKDAHKHRVDFVIEDVPVEIVGFYSQEHQGIFTHHDSFVHMHLITKDKNQMGHLDDVAFEEIELYLPIP